MPSQIKYAIYIYINSLTGMMQGLSLYILLQAKCFYTDDLAVSTKQYHTHHILYIHKTQTCYKNLFLHPTT